MDFMSHFKDVVASNGEIYKSRLEKNKPFYDEWRKNFMEEIVSVQPMGDIPEELLNDSNFIKVRMICDYLANTPVKLGLTPMTISEKEFDEKMKAIVEHIKQSNAEYKLEQAKLC